MSRLDPAVFWLQSFGFSVYKIMPSANRDNFTSSFPILISFISFPCLIALARTSSPMLNRIGESGYPCLVPYPEGKAFSLSSLMKC